MSTATSATDTESLLRQLKIAPLKPQTVEGLEADAAAIRRLSTRGYIDLPTSLAAFDKILDRANRLLAATIPAPPGFWNSHTHPRRSEP